MLFGKLNTENGHSAVAIDMGNGQKLRTAYEYSNIYILLEVIFYFSLSGKLTFVFPIFFKGVLAFGKTE